MREIEPQREELTEKERRSIDILEILRRRGPISRPDISKMMGINVVTISNYVEDFIKRSLVYEKELDVSEGGRRPVLLDLNSGAGFVIGVGLNLMNMVGLLVDLKGNIITKTQLARPKPSIKEISECSLEIVRELLRRSKEYAPNIKGIGVGIAGLINKQDGSIHWPQKTGNYYTYISTDLSLKDLMEKEFSLPALIENDATSACFGERWLGLGQNFKNILFMFSGVGCGIMINGEVYRGAQGYAGEVAISNIKEQDQFSCTLGDSCFLKRWELDLGIVEDMKATKKIDELDLKGVFAAARSGDEPALLALEKAAKKLGIKIAYLVNLFNPQAVIIGGGLEEAGEDFLNNVTSEVKEWASKEATDDLKIAYSQLRENAVALGAASLVMQKIFAQVW